MKVRAADDGAKISVFGRLAGKKECRLRPVKDEPGVFRTALDTKGWPEGEQFFWIVARDAAGNETHRVVRLVSPE